MVEKCEMCGTTENIQEHHISYEPEIKQFLCVDCHKKVHGHGVGKASGWTTLFEWLKEDAEILFKEGATNKEVSKACDISYSTASHWRKKLGLGLQKNERRHGKIITINVSFEDDEFDEIKKEKGHLSWRAFILGCAGIRVGEEREGKQK